MYYKICIIYEKERKMENPLANYMVKDITEMHDKFEVRKWMENRLKAGDYGIIKEFLKFRLSFIQEELNETTNAVDTANPEEVVDGLIDIIVVALGTLDIFQVDIYEAWKQVANANIAKKVGVKESRPNPLGVPDLIKPEGWLAPSHVGNTGYIGRTFVQTEGMCNCHECYMGRGY